MLSINLLPPDYKKEIEYSKDNKRKVGKFFQSATIISLTIFLVATSLYYLNLKTLEVKKSSLSLEPQIEKLQEIEAEAKALSVRVDTLRNIVTNHLYWTKVYDQIVAAKPGNVALDKFVLVSDPKKNQEITGTAPSLDAIADYRNRLENETLIKTVGVRNATYDEKKKAYQFSFALTLESNALLAGKGAKK